MAERNVINSRISFYSTNNRFFRNHKTSPKTKSIKVFRLITLFFLTGQENTCTSVEYNGLFEDGYYYFEKNANDNPVSKLISKSSFNSWFVRKVISVSRLKESY